MTNNTDFDRVWAVCVFPKTRQLNRFVRKWELETNSPKTVVHSNKRYRLIKLAPWGVNVATCVTKNMQQCSFDDIHSQTKKHFTFRELLLFSVDKMTPESLASKMSNVNALNIEETYLLYDLMELPFAKQSDLVNKDCQKRTAPSVLVLPDNKRHKSDESCDRDADTLSCVICQTNRKTETMLPCGCMTMCYDCLEQCQQNSKLDTCVLCRSSVFGIQHTTW